MIKFVKRTDLDIKKYDTCVEKSKQSNIFAFSWYLDICCDNWAVLILNNYEAVMPIPFRKKYFIKYVYPPLWILELGIFSTNENTNEANFIIELQKHFKFVELRLNIKNSILKLKNITINKQMQFLHLNESYEAILKKYNRNRKRELAKSKSADLIEKWNDKPKKLLHLFKDNIAKRVRNIHTKDYTNLLKLMNFCIDERIGELLTIYSKDNKLVSAAFFIKYKDKVTQIVCASDLNNRENGANTFSNDRAIFKYQKHFDVYNFGGSSMKSIAKYYKSFGAETESYQQIKYNNLPFFLKLFKR